jgi:hypothetical protein
VADWEKQIPGALVEDLDVLDKLGEDNAYLEELRQLRKYV